MGCQTREGSLKHVSLSGLLFQVAAKGNYIYDRLAVDAFPLHKKMPDGEPGELALKHDRLAPADLVSASASTLEHEVNQDIMSSTCMATPAEDGARTQVVCLAAMSNDTLRCTKRAANPHQRKSPTHDRIAPQWCSP